MSELLRVLRGVDVWGWEIRAGDEGPGGVSRSGRAWTVAGCSWCCVGWLWAALGHLPACVYLEDLGGTGLPKYTPPHSLCHRPALSAKALFSVGLQWPPVVGGVSSVQFFLLTVSLLSPAPGKDPCPRPAPVTLAGAGSAPVAAPSDVSQAGHLTLRATVTVSSSQTHLLGRLGFPLDFPDAPVCGLEPSLSSVSVVG